MRPRQSLDSRLGGNDKKIRLGNRVQRRLFRRCLVQARRQTVRPTPAGLAAPKEPGDIASGGVGFVPFVAFRRLVDLVTGEISADRGDVTKGDVSALRELLCAMNADRGSAPVRFLAQLKPPFRGGRDIGWRDETRFI